MAGLRAHGAVIRVALGMLVLAAIGGGRPAAACPASRATGARGDRVVVGFAPSAPYVITSSNDSEIRGVAIDLLRTLAAREGWRLDLIELSPETLRARLAACQLDIGVLGIPVSAALAGSLELSLPYLSTATTVIVAADDPRAEPAVGHGAASRLAHVVLRGLVYGLLALGLLAVASWLLNLLTGSPGAHALRWRRLDAAVNGPWAGLRWLTRSTTGRLLATLWILAGVTLGATGGAVTHPPSLGTDPLRGLVERAAHTEDLLGERKPDGVEVPCAMVDARACFRGFANGTMAAIAGPREVLCAQATALSLEDAVIRDDLAIPEQLVYLLPPASRLRARLDVAMLRHHEDVLVAPPATR